MTKNANVAKWLHNWQTWTWLIKWYLKSYLSILINTKANSKKKKKKHKKLKNLVEKIKWIKKKNSKFPIIFLPSKRTQTKRNRLAKIALKMKWIKMSTILLYMQYPHNPTLKWNELKNIYYFLLNWRSVEDLVRFLVVLQQADPRCRRRR